MWMAESKQNDDWNRTAALMSLIANSHRDPKKSRAFKPADFHPHVKRKQQQAKPPKVGIGVLKTVFVDQQPLAVETPHVSTRIQRAEHDL